MGNIVEYLREDVVDYLFTNTFGDVWPTWTIEMQRHAPSPYIFYHRLLYNVASLCS